LRLALRRYLHDWLFSLNSILSMVAFLVPLLAVMGIQDGMVGTLVTRFVSNPRHLEIVPKVYPNFPVAFFESLRNDPDTAFVVPLTRFHSWKIKLAPADGSEFLDVNIHPSGKGDTLQAFSDPPGNVEAGPGLLEIYISTKTADRLKAGAGDKVIARFSRRLPQSPLEIVDKEMEVLGVLPLNIFSDTSILTSQDFAEMVERYKDGFEVIELDLRGAPWERRRNPYYSFRLIAKDFEALARLRGRLEATGLEVRTEDRAIANIKFMDRAFTTVFLTLLVVVGLGAFASAASSSIDQVAKNRKSLAYLALLGLPRSSLLVFTSFQAAITGFFASIGATSLFLVVERVLNGYFIQAEHDISRNLGGFNKVCYLSWEKLLCSSGIIVLFMIFASFAAYSALSSIEPSEGMRDV
jgi:putative ABC transport system permease protein